MGDAKTSPQTSDRHSSRERTARTAAGKDCKRFETLGRLQQAATDTKAKTKTKAKAKAVPTVGLEPTTTRLRVLRSTN